MTLGNFGYIIEVIYYFTFYSMVETQNKEVKVQNNSREVDWVLQQVNEELIKLDEGIKATNEARNLFIKKNSDTQEEVFDIDLAEKYLEGLKDKSW